MWHYRSGSVDAPLVVVVVVVLVWEKAEPLYIVLVVAPPSVGEYGVLTLMSYDSITVLPKVTVKH